MIREEKFQWSRKEENSERQVDEGWCEEKSERETEEEEEEGREGGGGLGEEN